MNRIWLAAVALLLSMAVHCEAGELASFQFTKDVNRSPSREEEILAVTLDSDIYAATQERFADLRVVDGQDNDLPYQLEKVLESRTKSVRRTCSSKIVSLVETDDNSIEIVIHLPAKAPADTMVFHTPLKNYERKVSIFGSDNGTNWQPLVTDVMIFDYSRYMDISSREIALPMNKYRRLKAVIEEVTDQKESTLMVLTRQFRGEEETQRTERTTVRRRPLRIDRIGLWYNDIQELVKQDKKTDYPIAKFDSEEVPKEQQTIIHVHTRREPLTRLTLETSSVNFSRKAVVQVPVVKGVTTTWTEVGSATVSVFRFRGFEQENLDIAFPEQRHEEYRIVIANEDNAPLKISGVTARGNIYRAMFFASSNEEYPDERYKVYYGSEDAELPSYDTAALSLVLREGYAAVDVSLGPEVKNAEFGQGPGLQLKTILESPLFLGIVICLMVVVLALLLFRASRRIEA